MIKDGLIFTVNTSVRFINNHKVEIARMKLSFSLFQIFNLIEYGRIGDEYNPCSNIIFFFYKIYNGNDRQVYHKIFICVPYQSNTNGKEKSSVHLLATSQDHD